VVRKGHYSLLIRKTNKSLRKHRAANITATNAAKKKEVEEIMSDLTPQTTYTMIRWMLTASKAKPPATATGTMHLIYRNQYGY